ncbi:hypothetical protein HH219_13990 [Pseudoalteromonas sp. NEC-BIFX-2020_015]|uniref:hypothetical protein n=1 Tax=Pseudoalteromonas sp. NEC-BIFX-2020_015 TaxID=2729544 RepID=UPI0014615552|nr:hypothetical protein [Pseudoalteromonas sp. NEC-BIFX-2020_015]NMR26630.1 hypothetical protein [Pseudoalteromonas sp. NEC-BIFX-2020_015]
METLKPGESFTFQKTSDVTVEHLDPVPHNKLAAFELSTEHSTPHIITNSPWVGGVSANTTLTNTSSPGVRITVIYKSR